MSKRIIITGWAGFIGSNFLNKYVPLYPEIQWVNIDALTWVGNLKNISKEVENATNYRFEHIDIRDLKSLEHIYVRHAPTDIIHFAAESHVGNSIENPQIFTETNVQGTQNLLELHRKYGLKRFHYISTDEVYGDIDTGSFSEIDPLHPSNPYSASKAAGEMLVKAYGRTFGTDWIITRCTNNYGPNQHEEKLVPRFVRLLRIEKKITMHGDGSYVRDWIFVEDHCEAVWEAFDKAKSGSTYNIGWGNERTNLEIAKIILKAMGKDESYIEFVENRIGQDRRYSLSCLKIEAELWWSPKTAFAEWFTKAINSLLENNP